MENKNEVRESYQDGQDKNYRGTLSEKRLKEKKEKCLKN